MFTQSRISTQLALGFGIVIALLMAVGAAGLSGMWGLERQGERLSQLGSSSLLGVARLHAAALQSAGQVRKVLVQPDPDQIRAARQSLENANKENTEVMRSLASEARDDAGRSAVQAVVAARQRYVDSEERFLKLAEGGLAEEAKREYVDMTEPAEAAYLTAIDGFTRHSANQVAAVSRQSVEDAQASVNVIGSFVAGAILLSLAVAWLLARSVRNQLGAEPEYAAQVATRIAEGDLMVDVAVKQGDHESLLYAMSQMALRLRQLVGEVAAGAQMVADASAQIAQGNVDLSQRTEEQASTLEETAGSMEQLTSTVLQNAEHAKQASELAKGASQVAQRGGEVVGQVVDTMSGISESSRRIADISGVIDSIAFQTNILALNAAVEAARAGEQGRGFAVVASEVRSLAQRSGSAAKEIKALIAESVEKVDAGVMLVQAAGRTMAEIVESVSQVTDLIAEIAAASQDQSRGIEHVNTAVSQMDQVVQQNAALAEQATAATESMKNQAAALLQMVSRFKLEAQPHAPDDAAQPPVRSAGNADGGTERHPHLRAAPLPALAHQSDPDRGWTEF